VTRLTVNVWLAAISAIVAFATAFAALRVAQRVSASRSARVRNCLSLAGAAVVGIGVGCANTVGSLSFALDRTDALGATLGKLASSSLFGASVCAAGLWLCGRARFSPLPRGALPNFAVTLVGALLILSPDLSSLAPNRVSLSGFCGPGLCGEVELIAIALASAVLAALTVTSVIAVYGGRLEVRAGHSKRELDEVHARLQYLATHDSLTGLPNWLLFKEKLAGAVTDTDRPGRAIAVVVIDLDRFSSFNHSMGHGAGDWLLAEVARRVGAVSRPEDTFARLGSDEFVVLIDNVAARVEAKALTTRILATLEEPVWLNGTEVYVRPSIGISVWPDDGRRVDDLLAHAEAAMASAKRRGGNSAEFFRREMTDSMQERLALENDLRRAVAAGEFELWFQPELSAKSGRIATAEALLRWRHPQRGVIGPASFIPLAEETGLMIPLGEWVIREVCRLASQWQVNGSLPIRVAVNLSATQFRHQNLLEVIRSSLQTSGLNAACLEVELTESSVMTNPEESAGVLKQLRRMGITVAIDDFGVGYSSLSYLRRFPIDKLKIDRSFVRDLPTSATDESIVKAIISLAHSVSLQVVAEGVETEEQLDFLRALGCDLWQGYYCCEPQPAAIFGETLAEQLATRTGIIAALARASNFDR
jgi:diguanylate cyclase (GGDEF)-like protein